MNRRRNKIYQIVMGVIGVMIVLSMILSLVVM